ncbi:hypothetical protein SPRG_08799 [Saprolegnia parasitica CBS 223.65]|uniref:Glycosyltransferase n=1 Tax=Saprolegnia parasitica (strain CBS 223.65) TaxID=695850 RepID=A0A067CH37_SAPPC|nr:hypothetical protein SPRG_08799 [Saprolegnia parasitica CBS 223.65]KDO25856.1 hypothetical protein SPRG_08799 [Saprolegnia parasitica CBS 223.65]|eukprot:XP_012203419.1 hypothetical protein SPRG_08799 [Saprolegnia parasitica CBS 223.65]
MLVARASLRRRNFHAPRSLVDGGDRILREGDPMTKVRWSLATQQLWQQASLPLCHEETWCGNPPDYPARGPLPRLYDPKDMPSDKSTPIPIGILHGLAHIELGAIDNYWDTVVRFAPRPADDVYHLPRAFYDDFANVACDEARHFALVENRLRELDSFYGQLPAHRALLEHAANTRSTLAARLAVIPLVQEARGLDAGPRLVHKLKSLGDPVSADVVAQIVLEERGHVARGIEWFTYLCGQIQKDPVPYFHELVREFSPTPLEMASKPKKATAPVTPPRQVNRPTNGKTLVVSGCVWPERTSSAAGVRTTDMIEMARDEGYDVICISPCRPNEHTVRWEADGVACVQLDPNTGDVETFLKTTRVDAVVFDRFIAEEMYGWHFATHVPSAKRILDLQDVHFLRKAREHLVLKAKVDFEATLGLDIDVEPVLPSVLRELASIYRSDTTLYVSEFEKTLLVERFGVPSASLEALDYMLPLSVLSMPSPFEEREHVAVIGSFKHPPNVDGLKWLTSHIWPRARERLGEDVELHIYGSYASARDMKHFEQPRENVRMMGFCKDVHATLGQYRVSLAPLRFGAGIKGKVIDSWIAGTPVVSTSVGAEGLHFDGTSAWGGRVANASDAFSVAMQQLYEDPDAWKASQAAGHGICQTHYNRHKQQHAFARVLQAPPRENWLGRVLSSSQFRATEYMSRFIRAKNEAAASSI